MRTITLAVALLTLLVPVALAADDADPFAEGATWKGEYKLATKNAKTYGWGIRVTERKGQAFKGEMTFANGGGIQGTYDISGTAPAKGSGPIKFQVARKGFLKLSVTGKLNNGEAALVFTGQGQQGRNIAGTASLTPKN